MSDAATREVRVEVLSQFSPDHSQPSQDEWVFRYTVRITNHGADAVQLVSRHWVITDALDHVEEVRGMGVVGEQPLLQPGKSFQYSSWCRLRTATGVMHGTYQMVGEERGEFEVEIAPFGLRARYTVH